jgi:formylglycine-generating enzyme required for sulfatase activity
MDKYEITVGRFRAFVEDYERWISADGGSHPQPNEGEHLPGYGSGWQAAWTAGEELPADAAALRASLACPASVNPTWRDSVGVPAEENLPVNCISWYDAFAFCIWDGGRLATEAEWEYAAAGGVEERTYPWGSTPEPSDALTVYDCCGDGECGLACSFADILPVGSRQPEGNGRWGQSDLAGSMWEWVLDGYENPYSSSPCQDCAYVTAAEERVRRGGGWRDGINIDLSAAVRYGSVPLSWGQALGARCVRTM